MTKYVYIVQQKYGGHILAVYTTMCDAMEFRTDYDWEDEWKITPKRVIENYAEDEIENEEF